MYRSYDYCPRPLYPYKEEDLCSRFAISWIYHGIVICPQSLHRWEGARPSWRFVRRSPTFVGEPPARRARTPGTHRWTARDALEPASGADLWYHGWWGAPQKSVNYRQHISDGWGLLHGNPISILMNRYLVRRHLHHLHHHVYCHGTLSTASSPSAPSPLPLLLLWHRSS